MITKTVEINSDEVFLLVIGDLHMGDKAFGKESRRKIDGYIKWVKDTPNARVILNGDLLNTATRESKSSPFEQDMDLQEQIQKVADLLMPIKDKIIGAVMGNHERRIFDFAGFDPTVSLLSFLGIKVQDVYCKYCGLLKIKVGSRKHGNKLINRTAYTIVFHHTTGGGKLIGSKLNRVDQMRQSTVSNADVYIGSHNHSLSTAQTAVMEYNPYSETVEKRQQTLVSAGGYLEWSNSYAEAMQLSPMELGSPIIKLSGTKKEVVVTL